MATIFPVVSKDREADQREQHGFRRTVCGCEFCRAPCRHVPGSLDVADLERLCPPGQDVFLWAEEHLRALEDKPYPTLVPARQADGSCHWLFNGLCAVHEHSPFGCAFFDSHMSPEEARRRADATIAARRRDAEIGGLYYRVWMHLRRKRLIAKSGDREGWVQEVVRIRRRINRNRRRSKS
ncbi:MAG: hypothetical protein KatS3mg105_2625 [Gemmatales bacterium]|nr:MAG: hypothetical protein KatS3mg105_2625 [Gemmatales bacterium]